MANITKKLQRALASTDRQYRRAAEKAAKETGTSGLAVMATDSFVNFAQKMGVGADNPLTTAAYGFNPITRQRTTLEWVHRGSWLGGVAIDLMADDMTRAGVTIQGKMKAEDMQKVERAVRKLGVWGSLRDTIKWARLYGGALGVMVIDGQRLDTPFRPETVSRGGFKGIVVLDRWMLEPQLQDVISDPGPNIGLPKFYFCRADAPGLRGEKIHYSRCIRMIGVQLPYYQAVMEQMWGESVLERLWDRMTAFDSATTGMSQLIYRAWIRTLKIKGLRNIVATGGPAMRGLLAQVDLMRRTQNAEGVTLLDGDDEFEGVENHAFSGLDECLLQIGQQLSGALQIPLVRLFGQSPAGLNATGESDIEMYHDNINKEQERTLQSPATVVYEVVARSEGIDVPDDFGIKFNPLGQLKEKDKAEIAKLDEETISNAAEGLISRKTALRELKQSSAITGRFSNITEAEIEAAEDTPPPSPEEVLKSQHEQGMEMASHTAEEARKTAKAAPKKPGAQTRDSGIASVTAMKRHHDLDCVVENEEGSVRRGTSGPQKTPWEAVLAADYGFVRRTIGADGDELDAFFGPTPASTYVCIIGQIDPATGLFDEYKVMLGFPDAQTAVATYRASYSDDAALRIGFIEHMEMPSFKEWMRAYAGRQPVV